MELEKRNKSKVSEIKLGIIGCGRAAEFIYLPMLLNFPGVKITAVADPIKERRNYISNQLKDCTAFGILSQEMLNEIDAAIVLTPPDSHISAAVELLKNHKPVLVEKPLSLNLGGVDDLLKIEPHLQSKLAVGFNHRYWKPVDKLKDKLNDQIDKLKSVEIIFTSDYSKWNPISFSSNPLDDLGPHVFDLVKYIFSDEIISVRANKNFENDLSFSVKTKKEIHVDCRMAYSSRSVRIIKVNTEQNEYFLRAGSERINPANKVIRNILDFKDRAARLLTRRKSSLNNTYRSQLTDFLNLGLNANPRIAHLSDGIINIKAILAARKSIIENGKEVFLNDIE